MSDLLPDRPDDPRHAARMAALSLLLHQVMKRPPRPGYPTGARQRMGGDLTGLLDGVFGRHAASPAQTPASGIGEVIAGMDGLLREMREHGMERQVESWIGEGPNLPVAPQDLARVLDGHEVAAMARQAGTDRETLLHEAAAVLPDFVHRMTPAGRLPREEAEVQGGLRGVLGGLMRQAQGMAGPDDRSLRDSLRGRGATHVAGQGADMPRFGDAPPDPADAPDAASGQGGPPLRSRAPGGPGRS